MALSCTIQESETHYHAVRRLVLLLYSSNVHLVQTPGIISLPTVSHVSVYMNAGDIRMAKLYPPNETGKVNCIMKVDYALSC